MHDRVRQVLVTLSAVVMIVGTLYGTGVIGTRVAESAGGSLSATATLLAPAGPAFSIWTVVYLGLVAYVVWQWLPSNLESPRLRRTGLFAGLSMVLNAGWLLVTQVGALWASVVVIAALVWTLGLLVKRLAATRADGWVEKVVVDGTFGLYLGWSSVATVANVTASLVASGLNPGAIIAAWAAVVVLLVAAAIGVGLAVVLGARVGVALAMCWGLAWIGVGRLATEPRSAAVGAAALLAALVVGAATAYLRLRRTAAPRHVAADSRTPHAPV